MGMQIIGHRGARGLAPENTIASLEKAIEHHVDEIEFDVRITKDNVVILHHDEYVSDPSGRKLLIKATPFKALRDHKPNLATLEEVFEQLKPASTLRIEVKPDEPIEPIVKVIKKHLDKRWPTSKISFCSFSFSALQDLKQAFPKVSLIVNERWSGVRASQRARKLGTKRICMRSQWLWPGFIRQVSRSGYELSAYTINDPAKAQRWARYGLAGVVTDFPDRFERPAR
jgi:glycerophosphoryl diester phosphodiesterase